MEIDPSLETEVFAAIDQSLMDLYLQWAEAYSTLQVESEEQFLGILYTFFRLAYAMGVNDGVHMQEDDGFMIPIFELMANE